jgi:hypothetical protein
MFYPRSETLTASTSIVQVSMSLFSRMILVKKSAIIIIVLSPANSDGKQCFVHSVSTFPSPARANGTCGSLT